MILRLRHLHSSDIAFRFPRRSFSTTSPHNQVRDIEELGDRIRPKYMLKFAESRNRSNFLSLNWPRPPRNVLLLQKDGSERATQALLQFARHLNSQCNDISIVLEPLLAQRLHNSLDRPVYCALQKDQADLSETASRSSKHKYTVYPRKIDAVATFGGDGTILRAASLFSSAASVPPILPFNFGTLGFLSEWDVEDFCHVWERVYHSGLKSEHSNVDDSGNSYAPAQVLLRSRLRVAMGTSANGREDVTAQDAKVSSYALNELLLHRGRSPHLAHLTLSLNGRRLTTAIADGLLVATPTGSTAYSLSAGGSIVHPLVKALVVTPVCARSLSFRPLVLPAKGELTIRVAEGTRGSDLSYTGSAAHQVVPSTDRSACVDVSIDGVETGGLAVGQEVKVWGEDIRPADALRSDGTITPISLQSKSREWIGGVPCIVRGDSASSRNSDEGWVGGLNQLLKFNHPFGDEN